MVLGLQTSQGHIVLWDFHFASAFVLHSWILASANTRWIFQVSEVYTWSPQEILWAASGFEMLKELSGAYKQPLCVKSAWFSWQEAHHAAVGRYMDSPLATYHSHQQTILSQKVLIKFTNVYSSRSYFKTINVNVSETWKKRFYRNFCNLLKHSITVSGNLDF